MTIKLSEGSKRFLDIPPLSACEIVLWLVIAIVAIIAKSAEATPTTTAG